jgi:hypothetical protein
MVCRCKHEFCYKCGGDYGKCECLKNNNNLSLFGIDYIDMAL